ncbi:FAD-binding domain-containing protein [Aspergillus karnatakaensis]|uniref:FAD-binding oxidoreductase n=1 Tax=Aspergillus karnatakaensis TaxID=1810916 RepID=UPI003CCD20A9
MAITNAIRSLQAVFPAGQIILPATEEYDRINGSYLSALESDITPACIFRPASANDVALFIRTIQPLNAPFAIRGAGQQPLPGCANIQDGITLDLGSLTGVQIKDGSVFIAAGERLGPIYEILGAEELAVTGSRSAKGGIGGGGLSFFSSREGFISDNVLNYEIVLSTGEIVNANKSENPDLWIALRGGGNNFGVVTRYDIRTFPQGPFWGGSIYYLQPSFAGQVDALVAELKKPDASDDTHLMISVGYAAQFSQTMCQNQVYYTGKSDTVPDVLRPFVEIEPKIDQISSVRVLGLKDAASEQAAVAMEKVQCAYFNLTVKADAATLKAAADIYTAALEPIKALDGLVCSLTLQPYPLSLLQKSATLGGNSLGLSIHDGPLVSLLLLNYWRNEEDDRRILDLMDKTAKDIEAEASRRNQLVPFKYLNYAFETQDPIASYGEQSVEMLKEVSRKYDPERLFQKYVPGGFKVIR